MLTLFKLLNDKGVLGKSKEDISKQNLFKGTLFHTYAYMENNELKDITDTCASLTAFFYIRVLDKKTISISLEAKDDIDVRAIKYVMFDNDVLISSPRGETISNIPPDWNENEPFCIVSSLEH